MYIIKETYTKESHEKEQEYLRSKQPDEGTWSPFVSFNIM